MKLPSIKILPTLLGGLDKVEYGNIISFNSLTLKEI